MLSDLYRKHSETSEQSPSTSKQETIITQQKQIVPNPRQKTSNTKIQKIAKVYSFFLKAKNLLNIKVDGWDDENTPFNPIAQITDPLINRDLPVRLGNNPPFFMYDVLLNTSKERSHHAIPSKTHFRRSP
ncbi:hypothetical protein WDW89_14545, partial [Deltaproteobacteria bacterium TL4]